MLWSTVHTKLHPARLTAMPFQEISYSARNSFGTFGCLNASCGFAQIRFGFKIPFYKPGCLSLSSSPCKTAGELQRGLRALDLNWTPCPSGLWEQQRWSLSSHSEF